MAGSSTDLVPVAKRSKVHHDGELRNLVALQHKTKTTIVETLTVLKDAGLLKEGVSRRDLQKASEHHSSQTTPYGKVVERMKLNATGLKYLDICNPFALLFYLSSMSVAFAALMTDAVARAGGRALRLIIYTDEMCPGNPYRPEKSRTLQCVYWAFADWPAHVLSRTFAWPCLCLIKSSTVANIEGGMSYVCRMLLRIFFPTGDGHSLSRGVMIPCGERSILVTGTFAGFLCDLKGHKENTEWKGYNGNVCCITCGNIDKRVRGGNPCTRDKLGLDHHNPADFVKRSNEEVFVIVDGLVESKKTLGNTAFKKEATDKGFTLCPNGILLDESLRDIYKPVDHTLRDWMHTMCSDGVANSCMGEVLNALTSKGFTLEFVRNFMMQCTLPSKYGKVHADWLKDSRVKTHTLTSFAGIVLTIVPIMFLFLCEFCGDRADLADIVELVKMLHFIMGILSTGPEEPMHHVNDLRNLLTNFHEQYVQLFDKLKPKLHHMHHIIDGMEWVGKLLACFVTERKHRMIKDAALHVFRYIEHTVLVDVVNKQCVQISNGFDLYKHTFLERPSPCAAQPDIFRSTVAILPCGRVSSKDVCVFDDMTCGRVLAFFLASEEYFVEVDVLNIVDDDVSLRHYESTGTRFIACARLVDACIWHFTSREGVIRICVPPILLLRNDKKLTLIE
jgi:hypothetical protein